MARAFALLTTLLLLAFQTGPARAGEQACKALTRPPDTLQVAWISPIRDQVSGRRHLEVIRVSDLRSAARRVSANPTRLLQTVALVGKRGGGLFTPDRWKITIFDVRSSWLCRPVSGQEEGTVLEGVAACPGSQVRGNRFFTGCGYTRDTLTGERGLDVYRIRWRDAVQWGFCVMPLERFLGGA